jgi:hypothetical protein
MRYKCPYLHGVWERVNLCKITEQQLWRLPDRPTPLVKEESVFPNTWIVFEGTKLWSCGPTAPETKNDFAGKNQQQFTGLYWTNDLYELDSQGFEVWVLIGVRFFSSPHRPDQSWGPPTQPPIQLVPGALPMGVTGPGCKADHSSLASAEVKIGEAIPPLPCLHGIVLNYLSTWTTLPLPLTYLKSEYHLTPQCQGGRTILLWSVFSMLASKTQHANWNTLTVKWMQLAHPSVATWFIISVLKAYVSQFRHCAPEIPTGIF